MGQWAFSRHTGVHDVPWYLMDTCRQCWTPLLNTARVAKLICVYLCTCFVGLILGDPKGKFIHIDHPTVKPSDICAVEVLSKAASKCALALLDVFFSKECLARSLATKKEDKDLLDPDIIEGIRCKIKLCLCCLYCFTLVSLLSVQCTSTTNIPAPHLRRREVGR